MTSGGNSFNYFPQNQLTKFTACSLNNNSKQRRWNKLKNTGTDNLRVKQAENFFSTVVHKTVTLKLINLFSALKDSLDSRGLQVICEQSK